MASLDDLYSTFRFEVVLTPSGRFGEEPLVRSAAFSEVSGLEISLESIEVREGGFNSGVRRLVGKASHPTLVLKRGMTVDTGFWNWIQACFSGRYPLPYLSGQIVQHLPGPRRENQAPARWSFENGIAIQVKASDLNAASGAIPIEELHINHEGLRRVTG